MRNNIEEGMEGTGDCFTLGEQLERNIALQRGLNRLQKGGARKLLEHSLSKGGVLPMTWPMRSPAVNEALSPDRKAAVLVESKTCQL